MLVLADVHLHGLAGMAFQHLCGWAAAALVLRPSPANYSEVLSCLLDHLVDLRQQMVFCPVANWTCE